MNTDPELERVYAQWDVKDSIHGMLAAAIKMHQALFTMHQALKDGDLQQELPISEERLRRIESETSALQEDLVVLKRDYEAQIQAAI
jgi:hypothetical protein